MNEKRTQMLSLSFRPHRFPDMVGMGKITAAIQGHIQSGRKVKAWMFSGETGVGKTTLARILAVSLQCPHQKVFGSPCDECYEKISRFDILEINASDLSGADDMRQIASGCLYAPRPPSQHRVFILDEAQRISGTGKDVLLKFFEDCPETSVWIICTTDPQKIVKALRERCVAYHLPLLSVDNVGQLVSKAMIFVGGNPQSAEPLVEQLLENGIFSPRPILFAVEKFLAGKDPKQAVVFDSETALDTLKMWRAVLDGDWSAVRTMLKPVQPDEGWTLPNSLAGWLRGVILNGDHKSRTAADGIAKLAAIQGIEDGKMRYAAFVGIVFDLTQRFKVVQK